MHSWDPKRPEEGSTSFGIGVKNNCKLPCWCQEPNSDPLQEQVLLNTEPSHWPLYVLRDHQAQAGPEFNV